MSKLIMPLLLICLYSVAEKSETPTYRGVIAYMVETQKDYTECSRLLQPSISLNNMFDQVKIGQVVKIELKTSVNK